MSWCTLDRYKRGSSLLVGERCGSTTFFQLLWLFVFHMAVSRDTYFPFATAAGERAFSTIDYIFEM